jgi:hypothetical protein
MAYVMLGRCERLEDLYITGNFSPEQIKCDKEALAESKRLSQMFDESQQIQNEQRAKHWKISFLNVRSMKSSNGHREDVAHDNLLMDTDIFALGETWLENDDSVEFDGYTGFHANFGNGKGIAGYSKMDIEAKPKTVSSETYSAIFFKTRHFNIIFLYLSSNYKKSELFELLDGWIEDSVPIAVMGDVNENLDRLPTVPFSRKMASLGFEQLIKEPTCTTGNLIDHIYINAAMKSLKVYTEIDAAYYSDHDIISLCVKNQE